MGFLIENVIQLWVATIWLSASVAVLLLMKIHRLPAYQGTPIEEFQLLFSCLRKTWIPGLNLFYTLKWIWLLLMRRDRFLLSVIK